jgi:hypothetical protein
MSSGKVDNNYASPQPLNGYPNNNIPIVATIVTGPGIWNFFNALAFVILITLVFMGIFWALSSAAYVAEIRANWNKYRCDPGVMPFASIYGHDTAENFNYCVGNIFNVQSLDITGPFTAVISQFTSVLSIMMNSINTLRVSLATLGGGVNVIFQEFVDRISSFFFQVRLSAIRIKALIGRMYTVLFAVMYMGLSGVTGMTSFSHTVLFGFLDTFCFIPTTEVSVLLQGTGEPQCIPIANVQIGDVLLPTKSRVTAKFHFAAHGQPMVEIIHDNTSIHVSSNHYLAHEDKWIRADKHPHVKGPPTPYEANSLICLNTDNHIIPIGPYKFRDYDETEEGNVDDKTMRFIEHRINAVKTVPISYPFTEYCPALERSTQIKLADGSTQAVADIPLGTKLSTGCNVIGKVQREIREYCTIPHKLSSSTLVWNKKINQWTRAFKMSSFWITSVKPVVFISLFVSPSSIIELADGTMIRDSMELFSPDAEMYYAEQLKQLNT